MESLALSMRQAVLLFVYKNGSVFCPSYGGQCPKEQDQQNERELTGDGEVPKGDAGCDAVGNEGLGSKEPKD